MRNLDISVIVPMYNVEKFILPLLKDLKKQEVNNAEFLLINDGSTDSTNKLVKKFINSSYDRRFILLNKENGGVSSARNYGLQLASGKYILFIDADDRLNNDFLKKYLEQIKQNKTEIEVFPVMKTDSLGNVEGKIDYAQIYNNGIITSKEFMKYICTGKAYGFLFSFIFKKELWQNVKFSEQALYEEDLLAVCTIMLKNPNIKMHINKEAYYYYANNNQSVSHTIKPSTLYMNLQYVNKSLMEILKNSSEKHELENYMLNMKLDSLIMIIQASIYNADNKYYRLAKFEFLNKVQKLKYISIKIMIKRLAQVLFLLFGRKKAFIRKYRKNKN